MASDSLTEDDDDSAASFGVHKWIRALPITAYFPAIPRRQTGLQVLRDTKITDYFPHIVFRRNSCTLSKTFLNLPAEIRVWIYEYALPLRRPYSEDLVTEDRPCSKGAHEACALEERVTRLGSIKHTRGYTALLVTCKTIYREAVDVLYSPVRSHNQSSSTKMQLRISAKEITIRGHGMFCSTHSRYREGSDVLFSKMRYLSMHILAYRGAWWDSEDSDYQEVEEYDRNLDQIRDMAQCRGNIHWAVTQLRTATDLSTLALSMQWAEPLEYVRDPDFMEELEQFLNPSKVFDVSLK